MNLFIAPHPPIILKEIGRGEEKKAIQTINGIKQIAEEIKRIKPKTIAVITPHGNVFRDALCVNMEEKLAGDFKKFNHPGLSYSFDNDIEKSGRFIESCMDRNILCLSLDKQAAKEYDISVDIDHGVLVPIHFIKEVYPTFKLVHISIGFLSKTELYEAGRILGEIMDEDDVIIASGDLSHRLTKDAPSGYNKAGAVYDQYIVNTFKENHFINILDIDDELVNQAGQCAQKPLELFIGVLEGYETKSSVFSYEGPFGVGYMTAHIKRGGKSKESTLAEYLKRKEITFTAMTENEDEYISLARNTIHQYIKNAIKIEVPDNLAQEMYKDKHGVFVSIKKDGELRGCIGTILPAKKNIAEEIIENAISASTRDPRFNKIEENELKDLKISVDILFPPEDIDSKEMLDVKEYGVIVYKGFRKGLLLPNLEGIDDVDEQISIALRKANIRPDEDYKLQRFKVVRHS
ncbi:MAG: AmmeMemoRadiSam system protein A [Clostridia bacterium]|nr:AmmeMemoRadiSam system protein A [Clostridia bacterium]